MAGKEPSDIEINEQYHKLASQRKKIVDAWAELYNEQGEEPKNTEVVEKADSGPSYVSETLSEYKDVAKGRAEQFANQRRENGETKTTGDPFEGEIDQDTNYQTIKERPNKAGPRQETSEATQQDAPQQSQEIESAKSGFTYEFSSEEVERIVVDQDLPETVHDTLKREMIQRAFGD